jgi:hypothetical protein
MSVILAAMLHSLLLKSSLQVPYVLLGASLLWFVFTEAVMRWLSSNLYYNAGLVRL